MAHRGRKNADESLALAVAAGRSLRDAAELAGVSERTAARRWVDPTFRRHVNEMRGEMVGRALGKLADGMADAGDTLRLLLRAESESVQLGAARALLELGPKLRESVELEERLAAIEAALSAGESRDSKNS